MKKHVVAQGLRGPNSLIQTAVVTRAYYDVFIYTLITHLLRSTSMLIA